ncbi:Os03g0561283 [Oryza sativa Japonica Group]|uniref:Os03g0561283 protein n=2 Tax=Oryza sativa subsp. japonica TaxID=39947 RepID=C7J094_ORYSJ|nr:Os03g0561249 [Oryza sativa Japonica Group]BAS84932.1 Os03g0561283 [Oryza sativa Japonica Group]|eukprot:NP_001173496.1 Os03g0561249 [Oryza sativa Japonica Group]
MPNISPFDFILSGAANRRERCRAHRSSGARSAHRRSDIVAVATNLDQAGASHHATSFTSTSSPFTLKKPIQWRSDLGGRHRLFQLRSTASIIDSILSDRAADVIPGVVPCRHGASPSL